MIHLYFLWWFGFYVDVGGPIMFNLAPLRSSCSDAQQGHKREHKISIFLVTAENQAELAYEGVSSGTTRDFQIFSLGDKVSRHRRQLHTLSKILQYSRILLSGRGDPAAPQCVAPKFCLDKPASRGSHDSCPPATSYRCICITKLVPFKDIISVAMNTRELETYPTTTA